MADDLTDRTDTRPDWIQPAIEGRQQACLHAGVAESLFPPDGVIAVGFGYAGLTMDGVELWSEMQAENDGDTELMTGEGAELIASSDPDHDWRIVLEGPLSGRVYQRHGPGRWVLIEQDEGFA